MHRVGSGVARVSRRGYGDQQEFDSEMEQIFRRCWLFVAHESEIASPGDYLTRRLGGEDVIVTRDEHGAVRVFLNSCPHRGTQLCRAGIGNSSHFRCSYHGWTFSNSGVLRGVPELKQVFAPDFDKTEFRLVEPPHVDVFRGLVFATWDPDAPPLLDELGDATWYLDAILSKAGDLEVVGPPSRMLVRMNWKLGAENFGGDGYHLGTTHKTPFDLIFTDENTKAIPQMHGLDMSRMRGHCVLAGNGHTVRVQQFTLRPEDQPSFFGYPEDHWDEIAAGLEPKQVELMSGLAVIHGTIFPHFSFIDCPHLNTGDDTPPAGVTQVRLWQPIDPMHCELMLFTLVPTWYTPEQRRHAQRATVRIVGIAGIYESDDFENFVSIADMNRGRLAQQQSYVYEAGVHLAPDNDVGWPGTVYAIDHSEVNQREMYRRWAELMDDDRAAAPAIGG